MQQTISHRVARPYTELAAMYDATLGVPLFVSTRRAFEELVRRYGINFRSAADLGCGTGLFARYLSRCWGVPTLAVDRSPAMLAIAMQNCTGCEVGLLQQDIRCLQLPQREVPASDIANSSSRFSSSVSEAPRQSPAGGQPCPRRYTRADNFRELIALVRAAERGDTVCSKDRGPDGAI